MDETRVPAMQLVGLWRCGLVAAACAAGVALAGCAAGGAAGTGGTTSTATPGTLTVTEAQNGATVRAARGQTIVLVLHSTYWKVGGSSDASVVQQSAGGPSVQPSPGCVPGQGCGTVTTTFIAVGDGSAILSASRTICGEALRCAEAQGRFAVTIAVSG